MKSLQENKFILVESLFIFILFSIKLIIFNNLIDHPLSVSLFLLVGITYMIFFVVVCSLFKDKFKPVIFFTIYSLISLIMLIDAVYFKQFNRLPSVITLKQFSQLKTVSKSVSYLVTLKNLLLVLDLVPLGLYLLIFRKKIGKAKLLNFSFANQRKQNISKAIFIVLFIFVSLFTSIKSEGSIISQEFFTYHIRDVYDVVFSQDKAPNLDPSIFEANDTIPVEDRNLFAIGKDKNLITIQIEALQNFVINDFYEGQEITPNLNKLLNKDSIYFDNYYQQLGMGNTSDAEFVTHNSLYPAMDGQTYTMYEKNTFYGLPWILKDNNYQTTAFHGYDGSFWNREKAYPNQGFDKFISQKDYDLKETIGLGLSDREFFKQSIEHLKNLKTPYYAFLVTLTSHHPYDMPSKYHKLKLKDEHKDTLFGNYLQSINYLDEQLGIFIEELKKEGLYENTVISLYGDHFAIPANVEENKRIMSEYLGYDYDFDEMMNIPLIIHIPDSGLKEVNHTAGGQIDFLPTLLNILGLENNKGLMFGRDLNNTSQGFIAQQTHVLKGSFIDDDKMFVMSRDGIFENSRAFDLNTRKDVDINLCKENYEKAIKAINMSDYILQNDILKEYIKGNKSLSLDDKLRPEKYISHAGGRVKNLTYTNSKESLDKSYKNGYKLIEVDMEWTSDGNLVLLHDWEGYIETAFGQEQRRYSTEEFMNFKMIENLTQMTIDDLAKWLKKHEGISIVTDIKKDNVDALNLIAKRYPDLIDRFIPQIYSFEEYVNTNRSGYKNIILTLYLSNYTDEEILDFAKRYKLMAITMPIERAKTSLPKKLNDSGVFVYAHTINNKELEEELLPFSVNGFYTDDILPK